MAYPTWLTPYEAGKMIEGVIKGNDIKRPLLFQQQFGNVNTTWRDTINIDLEFDKRNVMGTFAEPQADLNPIQLPNFGTMEFSFAYAKEAVGSPDYSELSQRMLGQQQDAVALTNLASQYAQNISEKMKLAYQRIENLKEWTAAQVLLYGKCTAQSQYHHTVRWDFQRPVYTGSSLTTQAARNTDRDAVLLTELVSEVDLTTLKANTTTNVGGGLSWDGFDNTSGTPTAITPADIQTAADPIKQFNRMLEVAAYRTGTDKVIMSSDAYAWFNNQLNSNPAYLRAADSTINTNISLVQEVIPWVKTIEGLMLRRMWDCGNGNIVPIYTYEGVYHDRLTGVRTPYMPKGYVLLVPPANYGLQRYGKIMHQKAGWQAMPTWINHWMNEKTGIEEWELHTNFVFAHTDMRSAVCWKVCSTPPASVV